MKNSLIVFAILWLVPSIALAQISIFSCSVDSHGKPVVLNSAKPGKSFSVAKTKTSLATKAQALKDQIAATKANISLSKAKKDAKLAVIGAKLADVKADSAVVKSCKAGSGNGAVRTQILPNSVSCSGTFIECDFSGQLLSQSLTAGCTLGRTIRVTFNGTTVLGESVTSSDPRFFSGSWDVDRVANPGPGTYVIDLLELQRGTTTCAAAHATFSINSDGQATPVENVF